MFLKEIIIKNYGSLKNINIKFEKNEDNKVKPIVLVGKNGTGKTLFLTQIIDSLIELKRTKFQQIKEVNENNYFKLGKKDYIHFGENFSYISLNYENEGREYNYTDCVIKNFEEFKENEYSSSEYKYLNINDSELKENGFFRRVTANLKDEFNKNIYLYFPIYRYYKPAWLNKENNLELGFNFTGSLVGRDKKNIIKTDILNEIENWILDLLLDKYLYELQTTELDNRKIFNGYSGKNTNTINLLNTLLKIIYETKYPNLEYARIAVSNKEYGRKISIYIKEMNKENEFEIAPTFSHLSSGETMILCLFASILKEYDYINKDNNKQLSDISGIVLIDEIDLSLHIELAKEVLPQIIKLFPKIQFILTTHSPFFLLGMKENFGKEYSVIDLPTGIYIDDNNFEEIQIAYNIFAKGYLETKQNFEEISNKLKTITKTLIITEGKTDVLHLKKAISMLGYKEDLDIEFFDFQNEKSEMGEGQLDKLLQELSKIKHHNKVIGIFDRDEGNGKKYAKTEFEHLRNNVYAFAIQNPSFRNYHEGISIEQLYNDEDIKRKDKKGRRLFLSNEFDETGYIVNEGLRHENVNKLKNFLKKGKEKIIDSGVYKINESVALSKNDFANNIQNEEEGFKDVNFEGFRETLELLLKIENLDLK